MQSAKLLVVVAGGVLLSLGPIVAQQAVPPPGYDPRIDEIVRAVSADRIERDIRTLVGFGTRHTLSDTESETRGIGAARRWRDTTAPQWQHSRFVGNVTEHSFENLVIDNYLFGVAAVGTDGNESVVAFPARRARR